MWIQANKIWVNSDGRMDNLDLPLDGVADLSQLAPYQQGSFFVMTSSNVKYPVALIKPSYGFAHDAQIFPGVAVIGFVFYDMFNDSYSLNRQEFDFLIPEAMTAEYIVYTQDNQHIDIPPDGQVATLPAPQNDFMTQLPFSIPLDQFTTVEVSKPTFTQNENVVSFSITISATNSDTTATHTLDFPVNVVDSNGESWGNYSCSISLGPSQTGENQCNVASAPYSADKLPTAIYLGIDGVSKPYFFKLTMDQIIH